MAQDKNDNWNILAPKPIDNRSGKLVSGAWTPFASTAEAHSTILFKYRTLTVPILVGGVPVEYWYRDAIANASDLVVKNPLPTLTGGATKDTFTTNNDTSRPISAGQDLLIIRANPVSNLAAFKVGTTPGGDDLIPAQVITAEWKSWHINQFFSSAGTIYISGITSSTTMSIISL